MENNGKTLIILLVAAVLIALGAYLYYNYNSEDVPEPEEATNGQLDNENETEETEWRFATTTEYSFQYPADLELDYVEMTDWPPVVQITDDAFTCEEAGEETDRAGRTESVTIATREYCRTTIVEGAAGSLYTQYAYAFPHNDGTAIMTFSTREPQCSNYDGNQVAECENEIDDLDIDDLADRMARTFNLTGEDE